MRRFKRRGSEVQLGDAQADISLGLALIFIMLFVIMLIIASQMAQQASEAKSAQEQSRDASQTLAEQVASLEARLETCEREKATAVARAEEAESEAERLRRKKSGSLESAQLEIFTGSGYVYLAETRNDPLYPGTAAKAQLIKYECYPPSKPNWITTGGAGGGTPMYSGGEIAR